MDETPDRLALLLDHGTQHLRLLGGEFTLVSEAEPLSPQTAAYEGGTGAGQLMALLLRSRMAVPRPRSGDTGGDGTTSISLVLKETARSWLTDPRLFWEMIAGRLVDPEKGGRRGRSVEVSQVRGEFITADAAAGRLWVCRMEWKSGVGGSVSWLVRESADTENPGKALARSLYNLRDELRQLGLTDSAVGITRQPSSVVDPRRPLYRLSTPEWEAYWPTGSVERLCGALGGTTVENVSSVIACSQIDRNGLLVLGYVLPRTAEERRSAYAFRTLLAFLDRGGAALRALVDGAYASGERFRALAVVYDWCGPQRRNGLSLALGFKREEQLVSAALGNRREHRLLEPWRSFAIAAEVLIGGMAEQVSRPGRAIQHEGMEIIRKNYLLPRGTALKALWDRARSEGELEELLTAARLSLLRNLTRAVPRGVLVDTAAGSGEGVQRRLSALFSRRGRGIFQEDVDALEAAIARGDFTDWGRLLAARQQLVQIAKRIQM